MPDTLMPAAGPGQRHALALELRADMHASGLGGYAQLRDVQVRDASQTPDGSWIFEGHAAVFNTTTTLFEFTDSLGTVTVTEDIAPGAFATALGQPDLLCHLNNGHDMTLVMASTDVNGIGGLRVTQDATACPTPPRSTPPSATSTTPASCSDRASSAAPASSSPSPRTARRSPSPATPKATSPTTTRSRTSITCTTSASAPRAHTGRRPAASEAASSMVTPAPPVGWMVAAHVDRKPRTWPAEACRPSEEEGGS
jgi:hypothetical protein